MIRTLFEKPGTINWTFLEKEIREVCSELLHVNEVNGQIAIYCESQPDQTEINQIANVVGLHNPLNAPFEPMDPVGALATLLVVLDLVTLEDASAALHEEPEHLVAEATAWSLGSP